MLKLFKYLHLLFVTGFLIIAPSLSYATAPGWGPWAAGGGSNAWFSGLGVGSVVTGIGVGTMLGGTSDVTPIAIDPRSIVAPPGWPRDPNGWPVPTANTDPSVNMAKAGADCTSLSARIRGADPSRVSLVSVTNNNDGSVTCVTKYDGGGYYNYWTTTMGGVTASCPSGYTSNGASCAITDPSAVQKPDGIPCQIIQVGTSFQLDPSNPACVNTTNPGTLKTADGSTINVGAGGLNVVPPDYVPGKTGQPHTDLIPSGPGRVMVLDYQPQPLGTPINLNPSLPLKTPIDLTRVTTIEPVNSIPTVTNITVSSGDTTPSTTGSTPVFPSITCANVGTCDVAKDTTLKTVAQNTAQTAAATAQIANSVAMGAAVPPITAADYAPAITSLQNSLPKPSDYQGLVSSILAKIGFPQPSAQCSLTRTITFHGVTKTIDFVPQGICEPYQQIANWMTWGGVVFLAWRQVKSMAGDKEDLPGST